jgi:hypothetical protein
MRLLRSLIEAGLSLRQLLEAAEAGTLNLDYIDLLMPRTPSLGGGRWRSGIDRA